MFGLAKKAGKMALGEVAGKVPGGPTVLDILTSNKVKPGDPLSLIVELHKDLLMLKEKYKPVFDHYPNEAKRVFAGVLGGQDGED